jgi:hypothetical protein
MLPVGDRGREFLKPPSTGLHFDSRYIMSYSKNARANRLYMGDEITLRSKKEIKAKGEEMAAEIDSMDDDDGGEFQVSRRWFGMNIPTRTRINQSELSQVNFKS